jgi:hypothetical protein
LFGPEVVHLLSQRLLDGPLEDRLGRIDRDLLQGVEVQIQARPLITEGPTDHDFSPPLGQGTNLTLMG